MADIIDRNKSYTNKDFQSIYTELLDLVPKLTSKWTPSESNEADPGVVLIKLMAVLGDKLNYNIDKQILECFPGTVTQRRNARQLYDLIGYPMKWYRSATLPISFRIKNEEPKSDVTIPRFTPITDSKNQINYVTLEEITLQVSGDQRYVVQSTQAMEGTLNDLTINGSNKIRLVDLDENYRIYFNGINIAENGIFISDYDSDDLDWTQVDNIDAYPLGSKVFQFKVSDDESNAYIQFPIDINVLVGSTDAVSIKYLTTNGANGNISPNILDNFGEASTDKGVKDADGNPQEENVTIIQTTGSTDGSDPESVDDAYKNSRLIIGTFNTLITRKDYENYIRRLMENNKHLVSNCVVADRTCDLNLTRRLLGLDGFNERYYVRATAQNEEGDTVEALSAYDIVLYALEPASDYNGAFMPITTEEFKFTIEQSVEETKAVNQDYQMPSGNNDDILYLFRNMYKLKGQIVTTDKLTKIEATNLEEKINLALQQKYSAYNVEFGSPVDYSELIEFIQSIDPRIKTVALDNPTYQVKKTYYSEETIKDNAYLSSEDKQNLVARMIASGNVQLFKFNKYFNKDFGQEEQTIGSSPSYNNEDIVKISTSAEVTLNTTTGTNINPYTLKQNEVIQLITPYYKTTTEYSTGCYVSLIEGSSSTTLSDIPANQDFKLIDGNQIKVRYMNSENKLVTDYISDGAVINCTKLIPGNGSEIQLANGSTLTVRRKSSSTINKATPYIIILNQNALDNKFILKPKGDSSGGDKIILGSDEYFIYTNPATTELILLGSGTELCNNSSEPIEQPISTISFDDIDTNDLSNIDWSYLQQSITANEMEITTINEGCTIGIKDLQNNGNSFTINGTFKDLVNSSGDPLTTVIVDVNGTSEKTSSPGGDPYRIKSSLNITYVDESMPLYSNQKISFRIKDSTSAAGQMDFTITGSNDPLYVQFSKPVLLSGGQNLDIIDEGLKIYTYKDEQDSLQRGTDGILQVKLSDADGTYTPSSGGTYKCATLTFNFADLIKPTLQDGDTFDSEGNGTLYLIPVNILGPGNSDVLTIQTQDKTTSNWVSVGQMMQFEYDSIDLTGSYSPGAYVLFVKPGYQNLRIGWMDDNATSVSIQLSNIFIVEGINLEEIDVTIPDANTSEEVSLRPTDVTDASIRDTFNLIYNPRSKEKTIFARINEINSWVSSTNRFNYTHVVEDTNKVVRPTLSSSYWNLNHVFNQYTIPCMDLDQYDIKVNPFSIR